MALHHRGCEACMVHWGCRGIRPPLWPGVEVKGAEGRGLGGRDQRVLVFVCPAPFFPCH